MSGAYTVPLFLRGEVITDDLVSFGTRSGGAQFQAPDMARHVHRLPLPSPMAMTDLNELSFDEILDVLDGFGQRARLRPQRAPSGGLRGRPAGEPAAAGHAQEQLPDPAAAVLARANVLEIADSQVGLGYLNGWVPQTLGDGRELRVRAFGSRVLHIPAGNGGLVSAVTILRSVITRCDTIIKAPSNDPLTAVAIARTLADVAPDHPITKTPRGRVLEGRRRRRRGAAVPTGAHRKDRRLGRFRVGQARHPLHPAGSGDDRARSQAQRDHHRAPGVQRRRNHARGGALRRRRHRRGQPGGVRQRARHLRDERDRRRRHRQRQQARRDDLRGTDPPARFHQHAAAVPEPRTLRPRRGVAHDRRLVPGDRRRSARGGDHRFAVRLPGRLLGRCCPAASPTSCRSTASTR